MDEKTELEIALERIDEIVTHLEEAVECGPALGRKAEKRARLISLAYAAALESRHLLRVEVEDQAADARPCVQRPAEAPR